MKFMNLLIPVVFGLLLFGCLQQPAAANQTKSSTLPSSLSTPIVPDLTYVSKPASTWCNASISSQLESLLTRNSKSAKVEVKGIEEFQSQSSCKLSAHVVDFDGSRINLTYYLSSSRLCSSLDNETICKDLKSFEDLN